jgi:hypothetical protein
MITRILCFFGFHQWIISDEVYETEDENFDMFTKTSMCINCKRFSIYKERIHKD